MKVGEKVFYEWHSKVLTGVITRIDNEGIHII